DGDLWFAECTAGRIGHIATASPNAITEITLGSSARSNGVAAGPQGKILFPDDLSHLVHPIAPRGTSPSALFSTHQGPLGIATGPDHNLWFTETIDNQIGRLTPNGVLVEFLILSDTVLPNSIAAGPDGNVWFTERAGDAIGRVTPSGAITEFDVTTHAAPMGITLGPDGNLWFAESGTSNIGRFTPPQL